jgi:glucose/arabinose dehydrogenase
VRAYGFRGDLSKLQHRLVAWMAPLLVLVALPGAPSSARTQVLSAELVEGGLAAPVFVTAAPGDARLFVLERAGLVRILEAGELVLQPFLDIRDRVDTGGEGGLLGLAFPPDFGFDPGDVFYVYYTAEGAGGAALESRIGRFGLDAATPTVEADEASENVLFRVDQPFGNHNGGTIAFRAGLLYLGLGDGGDRGDPDDLAQDPTSLLGKLLRFDPEAPGSWSAPEVFASGLRNPYRFSFDRQTGDLWIGDVGQNAWEEVDVLPATAPVGANFGWDVLEGNACYVDPDGAPDPGEPACDDASLTPPLHAYAQQAGSCSTGGSGSVTGGYVYRGNAIPSLFGRYVFGDYCTGQVFSLRWDGADGLVGPVLDHAAELLPPDGFGARSIVGFGEDDAGELHLVDVAGSVYRIVPEPGPEALAVSALAAVGALAIWRKNRPTGRRAPGST